MVDRSAIPVFKNDPIVVMLLGIFTCGLYLIYWNIKIAEVLNAVSGRVVISPTIAVLSGCCMPVNAYFYYLAGESLGDVGELTDDSHLRDKSTMLLILGIFIPMASAMILQGHVNRIYEER